MLRIADRSTLSLAALLSLVAALSLSPGLASPACAIGTVRVAQGLARPIFAISPPDDPRLFIIEQRGVIKILEDGEVLATPFLNIDHLIPDIVGNDERGLLGLAFHPDYATNGYFYVNYINLDGDTEIERYSVSSDPNVADVDSDFPIMTIDQPAGNHNGGTLLFGPDGMLYIGMGDGGGAGDPNENAQNPGLLLGKILRIDVDGGSPYAIPPDNPFVGPDLPLDEIWDIGFRNPYRWSFDRETGDLWIGDVGQYDWEEIDFEPAGSPGGLNYGWDRTEGFHCFEPPTDCDTTGVTWPIHEYNHGGGRCSVTGGFVYRGSAIPSLRGTYFFADYCSDQIWTLRHDGENVTDLTERTAELAPGGGLTLENISGFGEDATGELYIIDRGSGTNGEVYKVIPDPASAEEYAVAGALRITLASTNPFRTEASFRLRLPDRSVIDATVVDPSGRLVRTLRSAAEFDAGEHSLEWDGRDDSGRSVPAGVYFVKVQTEGEVASARVQRIR